MTRLLLLITGASRGLGKAIAVQFCHFARQGNSDVTHLQVVLISRNEVNLGLLQDELLSSFSNITKSASGGEEEVSKTIQVSYHAVDLGELTRLESRIEEVMQELSQIVDEQDAFDRFIFINNAGTLGPIGPCFVDKHSSLADIQRSVDLNVTSALWLSARMARFAVAKTSSERITHSATIVNISSLVAVQAFPSLALYSAGKAARDQYHIAMAKEQEKAGSLADKASLRILNYAPGPLETDMTTEIRQAESLDAGLRPHYEKQQVDPDESASRLVRLVLDGNFENGAHIDYYDLDSSSSGTPS